MVWLASELLCFVGGEKLYFLQNVSGSVSRDLSFIKGGGGGAGTNGRRVDPFCVTWKETVNKNLSRALWWALLFFCERYCSLNIKIYK